MNRAELLLRRYTYIREHHETMSPEEMADEIGLKAITVRKYMREMELPVPPREGQRIPISDAELEEFILAHPKMRNREIREKLHVGDLRINFIREAHGLMRPYTCNNTIEQLCWECAKATKPKECSWVARFEYPEGVSFGEGKEDGCTKTFIRRCPLFVRG